MMEGGDLNRQEVEKRADFAEAWNILEDYYKKRDWNDAFPVRLLTGYDWSKKLLLGTNWDGTIDLKDIEQVRIFESYLKR